MNVARSATPVRIGWDRVLPASHRGRRSAESRRKVAARRSLPIPGLVFTARSLKHRPADAVPIVAVPDA